MSFLLATIEQVVLNDDSSQPKLIDDTNIMYADAVLSLKYTVISITNRVVYLFN